MKNNVVAIRHRQKDGNADSLVTPEMRCQIRELKRELDQYDNRLAVKGIQKRNRPSVDGFRAYSN
jgi:hypothetical protein